MYMYINIMMVHNTNCYCFKSISLLLQFNVPWFPPSSLASVPADWCVRMSCYQVRVVSSSSEVYRLQAGSLSEGF